MSNIGQAIERFYHTLITEVNCLPLKKIVFTPPVYDRFLFELLEGERKLSRRGEMIDNGIVYMGIEIERGKDDSNDIVYMGIEIERGKDDSNDIENRL